MTYFHVILFKLHHCNYKILQSLIAIIGTSTYFIETVSINPVMSLTLESCPPFLSTDVNRSAPVCPSDTIPFPVFSVCNRL